MHYVSKTRTTGGVVCFPVTGEDPFCSPTDDIRDVMAAARAQRSLSRLRRLLDRGIAEERATRFRGAVRSRQHVMAHDAFTWPEQTWHDGVRPPQITNHQHARRHGREPKGEGRHDGKMRDM